MALYDADSRTTWVIGLVQMEDEIGYYDSINRHENWRTTENPNGDCQKKKNRKEEIIIDSDYVSGIFHGTNKKIEQDIFSFEGAVEGKAGGEIFSLLYVFDRLG